MRVILPFVLNGQTLEKGRGFPDKIADGSVRSLVVKVDGAPQDAELVGYFKLSWEKDKVYTQVFSGNTLVIPEYITTLPETVNDYVDYIASMSVAVYEQGDERLTTHPVNFVLTKSIFSHRTENAPDIPEDQYNNILLEISDIKSTSIKAYNTANEALNKVDSFLANEFVVIEEDVYELQKKVKNNKEEADEYLASLDDQVDIIRNNCIGMIERIDGLENNVRVLDDDIYNLSQKVDKKSAETTQQLVDLGYQVEAVVEMQNIFDEDLANHGNRLSALEKNGTGGVGSGVVVSTPTYNFAVTDKDGKAAICVGKDENNQTFVDFVGKDEAVAVYNVTFNHPLASGFYTLATAIAAVPTKLRKPGLIVTFRSGATKWDSYQYTVGMTTNSYWNNLTYWQNNSQTSTPEADEESGLKWCAMGDSITEGWYSFYNADGEVKSMPVASKGWASQVAAMKGYELTNIAKGGTGFVRPNGTPAVNGKDIADDTNFADFDFVTIAYGVNDWKYNCVLGSMDDDVSTGNSIYSNMRYIIEKIMTDNPLCKIIVITPINCCVQGAYDTNWGLGYAFENNGTLEQIFDAIVEVCEWYGIEYIDMTHNSIVNRQNIEQLLIDKVHPSEACHKVMALELSKKIMF